jgi:hypothetical protein
MTKKLLSYLVLLTMLFSSCSKLEGMSKNATKASENSGKAAKAASESREEIANGRIMSRAGAARTARRDSLENMKKLKTVEGKVVEAATYYKAFEYQLWTGQRYDTDEYLESLMEDAMNELYRNLSELNKGKSILDTNPTAFRILPWRLKRDSNLLAMALGLHKLHGLQMTVNPQLLNDYSINSAFKDDGMSPLDLIKDAMIKINEYENGFLSYGEFKPHEVVVYENLEEFRGLLNTRYNMILTLAIAELTDVDENSFSAIASLILPTSWKKLKSEYMDINDAKKRKANKYLDEAFKLKDFMQSVGLAPYMYNDIQKIFKKMVHPSRADEDMLILSVDDQRNINDYYGALENLFEISGNRIINII